MITSLETSNISIDKSSQTFLKDLEDKLYEPATTEKAKFWKPKAEEVIRQSKEIYNYIQQIKDDLKDASTREDENREKSFDGSNKTAVNKVLFTNKKGEELITLLKNHRESLFRIDSNIRLAFQDSYFFPTEGVINHFFTGYTVSESLSCLTSFQNSTKINENRMVAFCNNKVGSNIDYFTVYSAIIGQSSTIVKPGEKIKITAGIGAFSSYAKPEIIIDGVRVSTDESGQAIYHFKSSSIVGKHIKSVKIVYSDQDGKKQIIEQVVDYTVSDCKN